MMPMTTTTLLAFLAGCCVAIPLSTMMLYFLRNEHQIVVPVASLTTREVTASQQHQQCENKLNQLDDIYNERRLKRQIMLQDEEELQHYRRSQHKIYMFDPYEPECVCFSEERFGGADDSGESSNDYTDVTYERYESFGDGPKFLCGVDFIAAKQQQQQIHHTHKRQHHPEKKRIKTQQQHKTTITKTSRTLQDDKDINDCLVYSIGSKNQIDFEAAIHTHLGCEIHTFDPTLEDPFVGDAYSTFHPWGLGLDGVEAGYDGFKWTAKSIGTIMKELGHTGRTLEVLKIDCEGCEYEVMPLLFEAIASHEVQVNQIQIEMHAYQKWVTFDHLLKFFQKADEAKMRIFHKERNHWGCEGWKCLEYAFVSEDFLRQANAAIVC